MYMILNKKGESGGGSRGWVSPVVLRYLGIRGGADEEYFSDMLE